MEVLSFHPPILYNKRNIFLGKGYGINYGAIGKISWVHVVSFHCFSRIPIPNFIQHQNFAQAFTRAWVALVIHTN
jgi:hypothetical protein